MLLPVVEASKFVAFETLLVLVLDMRPGIASARTAQDRGDPDADLRDG